MVMWLVYRVIRHHHGASGESTAERIWPRIQCCFGVDGSGDICIHRSLPYLSLDLIVGILFADAVMNAL